MSGRSIFLYRSRIGQNPIGESGSGSFPWVVPRGILFKPSSVSVNNRGEEGKMVMRTLVKQKV